MPYLLLAFLLGFVSGLRAFVAPAVLWLMRHSGPWANVLAALAVLELAADLYPKAPARTGTMGLLVRVASGGFVGWVAAATSGGLNVEGMIAGAIGAVIGAYVGLAIRMRAIALIGNFVAGLLEDVVAIGLAVFVVSRLR